MKISYTVEVGEFFRPVKDGLAPANYDDTKHDIYVTENPVPNQKDVAWFSWCDYRLELKKFRASKFFAYTDKGGCVFVSSLETAWNWRWYKEKTTKFVVEHVYENNILIDIIVHKESV